MVENVENLIIEHLWALRNELRDFKIEAMSDLAIVKQRLATLESQVASIHEDLVMIHGRINLVDSRIDRIERRLELRDEVPPSTFGETG